MLFDYLNRFDLWERNIDDPRFEKEFFELKKFKITVGEGKDFYDKLGGDNQILNSFKKVEENIEYNKNENNNIIENENLENDLILDNKNDEKVYEEEEINERKENNNNIEQRKENNEGNNRKKFKRRKLF